jgi:signal transduction histidine kinase
MLPHIFERFTKAGRNGRKGEKSIGLGLSIARQIIEKHGGKITVESEEGKGTTFSVLLPLAVHTPQTATLPAL